MGNSGSPRHSPGGVGKTIPTGAAPLRFVVGTVGFGYLLHRMTHNEVIGASFQRPTLISFRDMRKCIGHFLVHTYVRERPLLDFGAGMLLTVLELQLHGSGRVKKMPACVSASSCGWQCTSWKSTTKLHTGT